MLPALAYENPPCDFSIAKGPNPGYHNTAIYCNISKDNTQYMMLTRIVASLLNGRQILLGGRLHLQAI